MRYKVTVVGAGNVGATCAQLVAQADLADVVMVDVAAELATGKALDMMESAPVLGFNARITGGGDYDPTAGSHVCVVTAGLARKPGMSRDDLLAKNTEIVSEVVRQLVSRSPETILIIVTNPLDAMCEVARRVSGFPRERIFGMAGVLDAARMRWFIAEKLGVSVEDVDAFVLGGHGDTMVPLPRYATVNGIPLPQLLDAADRAHAGGLQVWALTGPGPNPLASVADRSIRVEARSVSSVQEAHLVAVHALCAAVERYLAATPREVDLPSARDGAALGVVR